MKTLTTTFLVCLGFFAQTQDRMLSFEVGTATADTLETPDFDTTKQMDATPSSIGNWNRIQNDLWLQPPSLGVYPGTQFTTKVPAASLFAIEAFPIRTSVKIFVVEDGDWNGVCSGTMVSRKHVVTAAHCLASWSKDSIGFDSIFISPVFDNGKHNRNFPGSWVSKVYIPENWSQGKDYSVLELSDHIGEKTGWVGIGYDRDDDRLLDGIFYKFSYPHLFMPTVDSNPYNGDTLYVGYGIVDLAKANWMRIQGTSGIVGESGSSLIKVDEMDDPITYGVLRGSKNLSHTRFSPIIFNAIKNIIQSDYILARSTIDESEIELFPNPAHDLINIRTSSQWQGATLSIINVHGKQVHEEGNVPGIHQIDIHHLPKGMYIISLSNGISSLHIKLITQ